MSELFAMLMQYHVRKCNIVGFWGRWGPGFPSHSLLRRGGGRRADARSAFLERFGGALARRRSFGVSRAFWWRSGAPALARRFSSVLVTLWRAGVLERRRFGARSAFSRGVLCTISMRSAFERASHAQEILDSKKCNKIGRQGRQSAD